VKAINLRLPEDLHALACTAADAEDRSLAAFIRTAVREAIMRRAARDRHGSLARQLHAKRRPRPD
jgi:hypothetical protein